FELEGFDNIVVGTGVETGHLVGPVVARGENQYGKSAAFFPQGLDQADAIQLRETQVDDRGIVIVFGGFEETSLAVAGTVDDIAAVAQGLDEARAQQVFVFYYQQAHGETG